MKKSLVVAALLVLAGCGGGGGSTQGPSKPPPRATPVPLPTPSPRAYQTRYVVAGSTRRLVQVVPLGSSPVAPPGGSVGGPVAGAIVTYPDGSRQLADGSGVFVPSQSSYGAAHRKLLQTVPEAQPYVVIADPTGSARPIAAHVSAYDVARKASARSRRVEGGRRVRSSGITVNLAAVTTLPDLQYVVGGDQVVFDLEGTDSAGNVIDLSGATITWTAQAGTIVALAGTHEAIYFAPDSVNGTVSDQISAAVVVPPSTVEYDASSNVVSIGSAAATRVDGTAKTAAGAPVAGGLALLAQGNLPRGFGPNYWLAGIDGTGAFSLGVPGGATFAPALGVPGDLTGDGNFDLLAAVLADGSTVYRSSPGGAVDSLALVVGTPPTVFADLPPQAFDSLPSSATNVRDAWYATNHSLTDSITAPDSGLRSILANPPASVPSPAQPTPVGSGRFATACYQWENLGGALTLVVATANGPGCTQPDIATIAITPSASNAFSFTMMAGATPNTMIAPLDPSPPGTQLVAAGTWQQAPQAQGAALTSDDVSAQIALYDAVHQDPASPLFDETLTYHYGVDSSGTATTTISADALTSHDTGAPVSTYSGTRTQPATCSAPSSACLTETGALTRTFETDAGTVAHQFSVTVVLNRDGSAQLTYTSTTSGDASRVQMTLPSTAVQMASGCRVCSASPGIEYDVDGTSVVAQFTINAAGYVREVLVDPATLAPIDTLGFVL